MRRTQFRGISEALSDFTFLNHRRFAAESGAVGETWWGLVGIAEPGGAGTIIWGSKRTLLRSLGDRFFGTNKLAVITGFGYDLVEQLLGKHKACCWVTGYSHSEVG